MNRSLDPIGLLNFEKALFQACGMSGRDAHTCADNLLYADLRGIDGHGVIRMSHYVGRLRRGSIAARVEPRFSPLGAAVGLLDGGHAMGQVTGRAAIDHAIALARGAGTGVVVVKNGGHFGAAGYYGTVAAEQGLIAAVFANTDSILAPFGARVPFFGSNPISFAFPSPSGAACVDMATTAVPYGKVVAAKVAGEKIPSHWGLDGSGSPTEDPARVRALHPMAGPKGSGLAWAIESLTALLARMPYGPDIPAMYGDPGQPRQLSQLFWVLDPERFLARSEFASRMDEMTTRLRDLPPAAGFANVCAPGDPEAATLDRRSRDGIPVSDALYGELAALANAAELGAALERAVKS